MTALSCPGRLASPWARLAEPLPDTYSRFSGHTRHMAVHSLDTEETAVYGSV